MLINFIIFMLYIFPLNVIGAPSPLIELSYSFDENTPSWPWVKKFSSKVVVNGTEPYGVWIFASDICSSEHTGTHMDAPFHFIPNGTSVDLIPFENLYRVPGIKIDVTEKTKTNPDYVITAQDMDDWVTKNGPLPDGVVVLFETGWGLKSNDSKAYSGIDAMDKLHFPGVGAEAAQWMVDYKAKHHQRHGIVGMGTDTYSMDAGLNRLFESHIILLGANIFGLENVKNIHLLPTSDFTLTMLPMKLKNGSGGATRVMAEIRGVPFVY